MPAASICPHPGLPPAMHPIQKLFSYARPYRRDFRLATLYSVLNKFFDILPEVLIGAAVDVVVKGDQSFLALHVLGQIGITSTWRWARSMCWCGAASRCFSTCTS